MGFHCLKVKKILRGDSLIFSTKSPEIPCTHLIDLWRIKGWADLGATQWFWTRDPCIGNLLKELGIFYRFWTVTDFAVRMSFVVAYKTAGGLSNPLKPCLAQTWTYTQTELDNHRYVNAHKDCIYYKNSKYLNYWGKDKLQLSIFTNIYIQDSYSSNLG